MEDQWRGLLYPARLPAFHRLPPPDALRDRLRWVWIPEWDLAPGKVSRQEVLPFPALNLVVQPEGVSLSGPATRRSFRDLAGQGWAVGMLLRPAAVPVFTDDPGSLRDAEIPFHAPDLHAAVTAAMSCGTGGEGNSDDDDGARRQEWLTGHRRAASIAAEWLEARVPVPTAEAEAANRLEDLISSDRELIRVDQAAQQLGVSVRSLQRLARRFVGLPPLAMIRRYRLQEAAERLRENSEISIADVAADLGYADHAHLANAFREVLGFTPSGYRHSAAL
ncbi:helix-turn-helix domain-containing protein [Arthrobacter sp. zg-Y238]|uniref:helix-turn-helix domain-containing protein n=1 Tax=Arthrobacter sp. zg-Y238 TaxID=2964614 RepID=UPI0021078144|nr:helix-turn-helix domain-containing protein [Arthrobacter sp. zg-Y238]MCQ1954085.1 helix-turn-helix domain-containing protein [Arthrobacter sp. zg-Y238]